jgi:hypothetical protein
MRHLKKWKLFESNKYESFIRDIEDLSLELSDLGMEVKVWSEIDTEINVPVPNSYKEAIQVNIKKFPDGLLDIKEFIERASDILRDFNVKCFGSSQSKVYQFRYNDIKDDNTVITNLGEYRDVDFYEIYIRFYKPENVYHVIRYNIKPHRGGWSLLEVNINSKEEAQKVLQGYFNKIKNVDFMEDNSLLVISDEEYWNAVGDERYFRENRRLKYTQKLTESNRYDDIRENLNDILYEAQDLGYKTKVDTYSSGDQVIQFDVSIYNEDVEQKLDFYSLNDCLERIIDYVKQTKMFHNPTAHISYYDEEYDELKNRTVGWKNIDSNHSTFDYIKDLIVYGVKLKFRLKYKLYESVDSKTNIYDDIREIFSDVTDDKCDLFINKIADKHVFILSNKNHIIDYFRFSDIKDELLRLKDYLGTRWVSCGVVFAGDPERIVVDINEYNYDELDDKFPQISNLAVIFNI